MHQRPAGEALHVSSSDPLQQTAAARDPIPWRRSGTPRSCRCSQRHPACGPSPCSTRCAAAIPICTSRAYVTALAANDGWLDKGRDILFFGPPGSGKSHLAAGLGHALVENGARVLFMRTTDLVQRLQVARQALALEAAVAKLDKYHLLILDDLAYVHKNQAEPPCCSS